MRAAVRAAALADSSSAVGPMQLAGFLLLALDDTASIASSCGSLMLRLAVADAGSGGGAALPPAPLYCFSMISKAHSGSSSCLCLSRMIGSEHCTEITAGVVAGHCTCRGSNKPSDHLQLAGTLQRSSLLVLPPSANASSPSWPACPELHLAEVLSG